MPKDQWGGRSPEECDARRVIEFGKNVDYWNLEQLYKQLDAAIAIFQELFPDKTALFIFDNSSAHGGYATEALRAEKMNLAPAEKVPTLSDGWYIDDEGKRQVQKMSFGDRADPTMAFEAPKPRETDAEKRTRLSDKPKGIRTVSTGRSD